MKTIQQLPLLTWDSPPATLPPTLNVKQLERYLKQCRFVVERAGDESFVMHPFFLLRASTAALTEWMRPGQDGSYEYWCGTSKPCPHSPKATWMDMLSRRVVSHLQLTDRFDLVEKSRYDILLDEAGQTRWLAHDLLSLLTQATHYDLIGYRHAIRIRVEDQVVAFIAERVDPEVEREQTAQRMREQHKKLAESFRRMEQAILQGPPPVVSALIARTTTNGFAGVQHRRDGDLALLGTALVRLYQSHFQQDATAMMHFLIDEHCAWRTIVGRDFTIEPNINTERGPQCWCQRHGSQGYGHGTCGDGLYRSGDNALQLFRYLYVIDEASATMQVWKRALLPAGPLHVCIATVDLRGDPPDWQAIEGEI